MIRANLVRGTSDDLINPFLSPPDFVDRGSTNLSHAEVALSPPEWMRINFLLLSSLMMPNAARGGIFMMKTGEMKWNGGSQNTGGKRRPNWESFSSPSFKRHAQMGRTRERDAERNRNHSHRTSAKFWDFLGLLNLVNYRPHTTY